MMSYLLCRFLFDICFDCFGEYIKGSGGDKKRNVIRAGGREKGDEICRELLNRMSCK